MKNLAKISWNVLLLAILWLCTLNYQTSIYISWQAIGQLKILWNRETFDDFKEHAKLNKEELEKLELIKRAKKYSVDSLGYNPTANFTMIYDQGEDPVLWAITASEKFRIKPYYWKFPVVGMVSYKGFFDKKKALAEKNRLICAGYDVDMRSVSAWSTLGWFSDPILSGMLKRRKGSLCDLIFHELFHATYYAQSSVDFNENLASFIAHKATIKFLREDTVELKYYLDSYSERQLAESFVSSQLEKLNFFYDSISGFSEGQKLLLKTKKLNSLVSALGKAVPGNIPGAYARQIMNSRNAWFIDFKQYSSLQDSLEDVFNKIYKGDIRKMVQSLK